MKLPKASKTSTTSLSLIVQLEKFVKLKKVEPKLSFLSSFFNLLKLCKKFAKFRFLQKTFEIRLLFLDRSEAEQKLASRCSILGRHSRICSTTDSIVN